MAKQALESPSRQAPQR